MTMPHLPHRSRPDDAPPSPPTVSCGPELALDHLVLAVERLNHEFAGVHQALRELTEQLDRHLVPAADRPSGSAKIPTPAPTAPRADHLAAPSGDGGSSRVDGHPHPAGDLADVPLLSVGEIDVRLGPVRTLEQLDDIEARIRGLAGVDAVAVTAFAGSEVHLTVQLDQPTPLAGLLRTELGRPVASCRLAEGRIVLTFGDPVST